MFLCVLYVKRRDVPSGGTNEIDLSLSNDVVWTYGENVMSSYLSIKSCGIDLDMKKHCGSICNEQDGTPCKKLLHEQMPETVVWST